MAARREPDTNAMKYPDTNFQASAPPYPPTPIPPTIKNHSASAKRAQASDSLEQALSSFKYNTRRNQDDRGDNVFELTIEAMQLAEKSYKKVPGKQGFNKRAAVVDCISDLLGDMAKEAVGGVVDGIASHMKIKGHTTSRFRFCH